MNNYTPLDIEKFHTRSKESSIFNTVLLLIATITTAVLATLLFILIQKRMNQQKINSTIPVPTTIVASPIPTEDIKEQEPVASPSVDLKKDKTSTSTGEQKMTFPVDISPTIKQSTMSPKPKLSISPTP